MASSKKFKVGSMFAGCGGFDLGFENAGFEIAWANDIDPEACKTYRHNIGEIIEGDVNQLDPYELPKVDVLIAGFPCQPFSNAGNRRGTDDSRGSLFEHTFDFIEAMDPQIIIYENVRGFLSFEDENGKLIDAIVSILEQKYGYHCSYKLLNLSHFGIPQNRIRVVLVAVKNPEYLPHVFPSVEVNNDLSILKTLKGLTKRHKNQTELLPLNPQALKYGAMIPEGGSWKSLEYAILPDRWKKIRDDMPRYHYPNFFRRYHRNDVMGTITAAFKPENAAVWHSTKGCVYSVREIARFQTFPDDFEFLGRSIKSKYQQIGNAVPPLFAQKLAERLKLVLEKVPVTEIASPEITIEDMNVNRPPHLQKGLSKAA